MSPEAVLERIAAQRVVPVLRAADPADAVASARACASAGMSVIELTRSTPAVEDALEELRDHGLVLGLGTITAADQVARAHSAGATFVVSFACPPGFVAAARELGIEPIPGALTPSEVHDCLKQGATAVKLFPARLLEPAYLRDLRAVMPALRPMVTGGLSASDAPAWLHAGAFAVGVGSELGSVAEHGAREVERRARTALDLSAV